MLDAVWSGARGWLTPPVLFVFINVVIGTIAVMSKLMSATAPGDGEDRRRLMRAPSVAFDRLRCFSFSRLGVLPAGADHAPAPQHQAFDDGGVAEAASPVRRAPDGGEWRSVSLLRAPSVALDRLRGFSFSRRGGPDPVAADHAPAAPPTDRATDAVEPSSFRQTAAQAKTKAGVEPGQAGIERSRSEAAAEAPARRRPRARRSAREVRVADGHGTAGHELPPAVEVDARADDFIRQFREQLRLQRLDSILRHEDTLRRTGTA